MIIQRVSLWSGRLQAMDLPITPAQLQAWIDGEVIQSAMPDLTPEQREFLISGMTAEEWAEMSQAMPETEQRSDLHSRSHQRHKS